VKNAINRTAIKQINFVICYIFRTHTEEKIENGKGNKNKKKENK
jgi:hypothetical protein